MKGKEILWNRGAKATGRPYLARAAEEHGGPHEPWFWIGKKQGGGVLIDMMTHGQEVARFILTGPNESNLIDMFSIPLVYDTWGNNTNNIMILSTWCNYKNMPFQKKCLCKWP